jgi:hypothetical protein
MGFKRVAVFLAALAPLCAHATAITWGFEGYTNGGGLPGGSCPLAGCQDIFRDVPFAGTLAFDLNAPDSNGSESFAEYFSSGGPYGIRLQVGDHYYESHSLRVLIFEDSDPFGPHYNIFSNEPNGLFRRMALLNCDPSFRALVGPDLHQSATPLPGSHGGCYDPSWITGPENQDVALFVKRFFAVPEPPLLLLVAAIPMVVGGVRIRAEISRRRRAR